MINNLLASLILFLTLLLSCRPKTRFEKISSEKSGIQFQNTIQDNDTLNIIDFEYIYNGGGVGVGDFNNDGLQDLVFTGNQVSSEIYLNQDNFSFKNISKESLGKVEKRWHTGVSIVDINNDGLSDIYFNCSVYKTEKQRCNQLFVNQGIKNEVPVFKEMAAEYGLDDSGHSQHTAFFDYDNDGDLDAYILTNTIEIKPNIHRPKQINGEAKNTDRLYECFFDERLGHNIYTNVSQKAGITIEGYGLGINICDINQDGYKDIYVSNDYLSNDLLYINQKNGTFKNQASQYFKHTSASAMGNDVADINNDGYLDILTTDMLAYNNQRRKKLTGPNNYYTYQLYDQYQYDYQYVRNTLQLNTGINEQHQPMFIEVAMAAGIHATDWSWTPTMADFDNDGLRDILITNGFPKDVTDRDFLSYRITADRLVSRQALLEQIPEVKISNFAYRNLGQVQFQDVTKAWGLDALGYSNGAAYADLDNDGDLDYIINNINEKAWLYKNQTESIEKDHSYLKIKFIGTKNNPNGLGAIVHLFFKDGEKQVQENNPYRGYLSSVENQLHFGLGTKQIEKLEVIWPDGKTQEIIRPNLNKTLFLKHIDANFSPKTGSILPPMVFEEQNKKLELNHLEEDHVDFDFQNLLPSKLSQLGPGLCVGDLNNDGLDDVLLGASKGHQPTISFQQANGNFISKKLPLIATADMLGSLLFDADQDQDLDIYICYGGNESKDKSTDYQDIIMTNDGKGNFSLSPKLLPVCNESSSCVRACDFDQDGDLDLAVAGRNVPYAYPKFASTRILKNEIQNGQRQFVDISQSIAPSLKDIGLICDILWTDFDQDGTTDLILAGEWSELLFFKNKKHRFEKVKNTGLESKKGLWNSLNGVDLDQDGDTDYIAGNVGINTPWQASDFNPVILLSKDFDQNGIYDPILFSYFKTETGKNELVPYNGKDDVNKQLNFTRQRFPSYQEFSKANFNNLFLPNEKQNAQQLTLTTRHSILIENLGGGRFKSHNLPNEAQWSTIHGIVVEDFDQDGHVDLLLIGNNYGNEVFSGRMDASNGTFLKGHGSFYFKAVQNSGFYVPGDSKALALGRGSKGQTFVFASQNRGALKYFKSTKVTIGQKVPVNARGIRYQKGGKTLKREVYWGSSYMSQSSRLVSLEAGARFLSFY